MKSCACLCRRKGYEAQMSKLPPVTHTLLWPSLNSVNQSTVDRKACQYDKQLHQTTTESLKLFLFCLFDKFYAGTILQTVHGEMLLLLDWQIFCLPVSKFTMWIFVSTVNRVWQGHIVSQSACVGDEISLHSSHSLAQVKTIHSQCVHIRQCVHYL